MDAHAPKGGSIDLSFQGDESNMSDWTTFLGRCAYVKTEREGEGVCLHAHEGDQSRPLTMPHEIVKRHISPEGKLSQTVSTSWDKLL